ncbi:MAG: hypothetical protein E7376_00425 [Clostridiales bacterium]|nr:hypothetical protein [Clostridiales bacterium]
MNYLTTLSDEQIKSFIKYYVSYHKNNNCNGESIVESDIIYRKDEELRVYTCVSDKCGVLEETWRLYTFKGCHEFGYNLTEDVKLTKLWAKYIYVCLKRNNKELAGKYKTEYLDNLNKEKTSKIIAANQTYTEKVF